MALKEELIKYLESNSSPRSARVISRDLKLEKNDINRTLYQYEGVIFQVNDNYEWSLINSPSKDVNEEGTAEEVNSNNLVAQNLELARKELLDLGFRNKLINHRLLKSKGVKLKDEESEELYDKIFEKGTKMYFDPLPENLSEEDEGANDLFEFIESPEFEDQSKTKKKNHLQTTHERKNLTKRLLNTYYAANTHIQETGVNVLYLALGMLHWYESESSEKIRKSPLILIPVKIERSSAQSKFKLSYTGDEIGGNLSLQAKLQMDFAIELPMPEEDDINLDKYYKEVKRAIKAKGRWSVEPNEQCLSFFSFSKFLMYKDLDSDNWPEGKKPYEKDIIISLLGDGFRDYGTVLSKEESIDDYLDPKDINQVVNADSSQTEAILEINEGHDLVVQGPPGTGKSQTITNIISESIALGKKVLFVSEKMAALEVVKRRMDDIDLGITCLELHSHKTNKKSFLNELEKTLKLGKPHFKNGDFDARTLKKNRDELNRYAEAVNSTMGESHTTPFQAYGKILGLQKTLGDLEVPEIDQSKLLELSKSDFEEKLDLAQKVQVQLKKIGRPIDHPFWGSQLKVNVASNKDKIEESLQNCLVETENLQSLFISLSETIGVEFEQNLSQYYELQKLFKLLLNKPEVKKDVDYKSDKWVSQQNTISDVLDVGLRMSVLKAKHEAQLLPEAWNEDVLWVRKIFNTKGEKWWRIFSPEFYKAKKALLGVSKEPLPRSVDELIEITDAILEYKRLKPKLYEGQKILKDLFASNYNGEKSDWKNLVRFNQWISKFKSLHSEIGAGEGIYDYVKAGIDKSELKVLYQESEDKLERFKHAHDSFYECAKINAKELYGNEGYSDKNFDEQIQNLNEQIENIDRISEIVSLNRSFQKLKKIEAAFIIDIATHWKPAKEYLDKVFELRWLQAHLEKTVRERNSLSGFSAEVHNEIVKKFCNLDEELLIQNRAEIAYKHWKNLPNHSAGGSVGTLRKEFKRKRRHKPIRKLMESCGDVIQDIKPVFMMSPLSVSTYLPPNSVEFDLVVFDEASQVKPVDAFSPLIRAKQAVVVGDSKQLPPTSFFETELELEDVEEQSEAGDMESILGLFEVKGAPSKMLKWHYRSEHESLIAVSNYEFYDNELVLFPSPDIDKVDLGVRYNYLPSTYYERGRGRSFNRGEAKEVAKAVMDHAENNPELTLGVAAFSQSQMKVIIDELEKIRRKESKFESFFNSHPEEPFFVKNLENVQGDERDVIFISVGYGKNEDGYVSMNFGPLNQDGGERRLNVLVTRARKRCEVYTNLMPGDIDLSRTQKRGMVALKRYLKYAKTGVLDIPEETGREADSFFEEDVAHELRQRGYDVVNQVGSAGFFVDLGVKAPESNNDFILGIECDGASYHSSRSARDRDRTRQLVLERIGWNIHRIWSTDWFNNREKEINKLVEEIKFHSKNGYKSTTEKEDIKSSSYKREPLQKSIVEDQHFPKYEEVGIVSYSLVTTEFKNKFGQGSRDEAMIFKIVDVEGPIHYEVLVKKVSDELGYGRVGNRIRNRLDRRIENLIKRDIIHQNGAFFYNKKNQLTPRDRSNASSDLRDIYRIAGEEVKLAILKTVELTYGGEYEPIIKEVGNNLGFSRVTQNIYDNIAKYVHELIEEDKILLEEGKLSLPN